jgi:hypothetical protein
MNLLACRLIFSSVFLSNGRTGSSLPHLASKFAVALLLSPFLLIPMYQTSE